MGIINFTKPETGNFLVDIILWLVQISSSVAVGIVLFTLILKLITFPFDYVSRASMRKNSVKMEEMRPELEKLQKQYADNKDLYNQKMMALYKKNGYSMFGACLPTILTLVIFIVAINAFTSYSQFQNQQYFYDMSVSYNNVIYSGFETDEEYIVRNEDGKIVINYDKLKDTTSPVLIGEGENAHQIFYSDDGAKVTVYTTNGYISAVADYTVNSDGIRTYTEPKFSARNDILLAINAESNYKLATEENNYLRLSDGKYFSQTEMTAEAFILDIQQQKSADTYHEEDKRFLWVKNIWVTDSPMKNPIESDWESFKSEHRYDGENIEAYGGYTNLIAKLSDETSQPNGYFILVLLTAGSSLLTQIIMSKLQKAQMELQTVDGQGAQTQKLMTWMMPIMMAIFAFMYTAAFSIYIILSSLISLGTTFLINFIVDIKLKKAAPVTDGQKIRGRVYTPKAEEKKEPEEKKAKKKKDDKFAHEDGDFLTPTENKKKHVRGRLK